MNKIEVVNDNLEKINVSKSINIEYYKKECAFAISEIKIFVKESTDLDIIINLKDSSKINFNINLCEYVNLNLNIICEGNKGKVQYKYNLCDNSICNVKKICNVNGIKEMVIVNLDGINSSINYNFKTMSKEKETYDYHIFHNNISTKSIIKNNGVSNIGDIIYQVSSFIPKDITGCTAIQNNRIINLNDNNCEILPNLYIDCDSVEAEHSALIGKFSDEEMFYIMSRGITMDLALKLLIRGFLTSDINDKKIIGYIDKKILKSWR